MVPDAQIDPFGLQMAGTCLKVVTPAPSSAPSTKVTTRSPTKKGKVAAAVEVVGAALGMGLRGAVTV